jgi:hypothetical protein
VTLNKDVSFLSTALERALTIRNISVVLQSALWSVGCFDFLVFLEDRTAVSGKVKGFSRSKSFHPAWSGAHKVRSSSMAILPTLP